VPGQYKGAEEVEILSVLLPDTPEMEEGEKEYAAPEYKPDKPRS
jgi:hypothetical protein